MTAEKFVAGAAAYWGLTAGDFAQVVAGALAAIGGFAAAFAAMKAAQAAEASVAEMRDARLQAVRPLLLPATPNRYRFKFAPGEEPQMKVKVEGGPTDLAELRDAVITLKNISDSPALDIDVTLGSPNGLWRRGMTRRLAQLMSGSRHRAILEEGGRDFRLNGDRWSLYVPKEGPGYALGSATVCGADDLVGFQIPTDILWSLALAGLVDHLGVYSPARTDLPLDYRYTSTAGQVIRKRMFVSFSAGFPEFRTGTAYLGRKPTAHWDTLEFDLGVTLSQTSRPLPLSLGHAIFWSLFGSDAGLTRLTGKSRRERLRAKWRARKKRRAWFAKLFARVGGRGGTT